ncbi:hypothetical protein KBY57_05585 [Cyanobium sp. Aljojuca 7D2]|uniref:hypothetical protein n=1 Tax=Cyanobium sp. Aljojuca 7D2 TaxID=2823698 RepID=UPI0020CE493D|nr:hypothetical protein [Cyanobium sp. Aljojuca 7D2]MCP9890528.1 hypothetical protein [Cyanobium sp. Aljojuca 7D2]
MASALPLWKACGPVALPLLLLSVALFTVGFDRDGGGGQLASADTLDGDIAAALAAAASSGAALATAQLLPRLGRAVPMASAAWGIQILGRCPRPTD